MGYIESTIKGVKMLIDIYKVKTVCDLGDQFNFTVPYLPAPYMSEWYKERNIDYLSIDLNGLNDSKKWDMAEPIKTNKKFDMVVNAGFSEHVKDFYQCYANIDKLTKVGGLILCENPRTKNWPGHAHHYIDDKFYVDLAREQGYGIIEIKNTVAAHNYQTGNNVFCILKKINAGFISRDKFPKYYES
jgi:hypothetical protein